MSLIDDLKNLDFKQPGMWPWPIKVGAFVLIFAGIQIAAGALFWKEQSDQIEQGRQEVDKQKQTFLEKKKLAVNLDSYQQQRAEIEQSFGALLKQLPNKSEMDALLIDINQAALGRGLAWDLFKPAPVENFTEFYAELPINIKVSGNYHDLGAFASDVAKMPRIVLISDVKLDPPKDGLLSMEAVAKTYRYLDEEEVAKQRKTAKDKAAAAAGKGAKK